MEKQQEEDFNNGGGQPSGDGQPENGEEGGTEEEIIIKKSEFEKLNSDLTNYRNVALKVKAEERELKSDKKDNNSNNQAVIDEAKIAEIAKAQSNSVLEGIYKSNESRAKKVLFNKYPELLDDVNWNNFISHYRGNRGKSTPEDILDDFDDAMLLYKRNTGKLEEHLKSERERAERDGFIKGQANVGINFGGVGDKNESGKSGFKSSKGEEISRSMHNDPEKVKKVDFSRDRVIDVSNKK